MKRENLKVKRTATAMLVLALVWMFLLPVQAFAEETIGEPVLLAETEGGDGGSGDGAADTDASEEEPSENTAETVPPGSAYLAPDTDILAAEKAEAESAEEDKTVEVDEPAASEPTEPVESEPTETEPAETEPVKTEPVEAQNEAVVSGVEEWTHFENTESGNAIQQAVDAAIAAGQKYITVVVQDGTYTGGLNIDNSGVDEDGNAKESIVVNIIAHDAYEHGETPIATEYSGIDTADAEDDPAGEGESASTSEAVYPVPINDDGTVDTAAIHTGSAGGVKLEGGVSVKNVELLLAGIYLSLKEQQENKEETKSGTETAEENNQDIKVEDADNFHYYGTSQSDTVNISLTDVTKATIDTGTGDDVLDVNTTTSPNVELDTDKEDSVLRQEFADAESVDSEVSISSGGGNDKITVTETSAVTDEDNVVSVRKGQNKLTVDAGDGADTVTLKGDSGLTDIKKNISEAIANKVYAIVSMVVSGHESIAEIKGGGDDDLLNLDTSFELGTMGQTVVNYQGEAGKNRLHFTGTLAPVEDNVYGNLDPNGSGKISMYSKNTVSKTEYSLIDKNLWFNKTVTELDLQSSNALTVMMSGVDSLTDDLKGKKTVEITFDNGKVMTKDENGNPVEVSFKAFTDYVYDPDEDTISLVSFSNDSGSINPGLLIKLIVKGQNLTVGENVEIDIPGVTLMLESLNSSLGSGSILIEGQMKAENIMLKLASTDSFNVSFLEKDEETDDGFNFGLMDVNTTGTITIASTAQLIAARVVDILAKTIQSNGLLPDLSGLSADKIDGYIEKAFGFKGLEMLKQAASINFVSVKMASAFVEILGSIAASSVRVNASSKVNTTASNSALRDIGLPFALSVILGEAGIKVSGDQASITADHDIYLDATSDITVNTTAVSGRLPFTVAVTVVDNDAYVDISGGKLVSTNGSIIANATGTVNLKTAATGSNVRPNNNAVVPSTDHQASNTATQVEMGKSGGFFAITVLNQDVFSALQGTASAIAKGDITVNSTAKASVVNQAASNPGEDGESLTLVKMLKMMAGTEEVPGEGGTVTKIIGKVTSYFNGKKNQAQSKEEKEEAAKKNGAFSNFLDKITGNGKDSDGDDVGSLVDKATTSANTGKNDSTNSVQMVGAVAVTYANNNNKAYIETDGEVRADGKLSVLANGELKVETLADGSPVKADDPAGGDEKTEPKDQHYDAHKHGIVKVDALTNGTILIGAYIGEGDNGTFEVVDNKSNIKIKDPTPFKFVVKAVAGYKLKADENGKYWITNEYKRDSDNSKQTEKIEVELVGKDADGCYLYKCNSYQVFNGDNLFKAEFVPKQHSLTVENNAEQLGKVEFSHIQQDGKQMQSADHEEMVYVTVNIKSGVTFATPVITYISDTYDKAQPFDALELIDKDGNVVKDKLSDVMDKIGDVQKDGTTNYYYRFKMPNGKVTMVVNFTGDDMNIKLDLEDTAERNSDVWITAAENDPSGKPMEKDSVYAGKVGDKVKIVIQLSEATYLVKNSLKFAGKTPVYIKDITDNGNGQYTCFVNIPAILKTEGDSAAANDLKLTFQTTLDTKEAQGTVKNTSTSLGAGLAVDVTRYNNQAYIANAKNNTITSGSVEVKADTADLSASAVSKAGYVAGDVGVAGAITVHLVSANNEALIGGDMHTVTVSGGDLVLDSMIQNSNIVTKADAAGDGADGENTDRDSVGVGAGIAVGVTNLAVVSRILDSVTIGGTLGNLNINAGHTGSESMSATAGAAGGTSVVPVLALNISGVSVLADSGKMLGNLMNLTGDAVVNAANSMIRTITADAAAVGAGVGVGASFIIDILNDSAKAKLGRSVKTDGSVTVSADSVSRLNATAKSGAQGSVSGEDGAGDSGGSGDNSGPSDGEPPPSDGSDNSDELPDDYYEGLDSLFGEDNSADTKNAEPEEEEDPESLAPLFRESEADAFVDSNKESAQDLSKLVENNNGNVTSENVGDAFENRQKAETSEGSVQVAATMVLNIQNNTALAQIEEVTSVEAKGTVSVKSHHDTDGIIMANASATKSTTGVGVAVAINIVTYSNIAAILTDKITAGEIVVRASVSEEAAKETADGFLEAVKKEMLGDEGKIKTFVDGLLEASGKGDLNTYIRNALKDLDIELSPEGEDSILSDTVALICKWVEELLQGQNPSFPNENEEDEEVAADNDDREDEEPETISEEEPVITNTQVAQFAKVVFNKVKDVFSNENLREQIFSGEFLKNLKKEIKDLNLKEKITSAVVSYLAGKLGPSAEEPEFVGPKISTSAVSGAGAANVGVAGSVAISVVNGTSSAYIADANNGNMTVGGNITVESKASQDVYTSAGASVDALGRVDKNKDDTDTANSTQGDASDKDVGTSVGVGAAVAMSFADLTSDAGIGSGWKISAKDLLMNSEAENNVETTSVSGTDPLARTEEPTDKKEEDKKEEDKKEKDASEEKSEEEKKAEEEEKAAKAMNYAVDASVSVSLIQNVVKSYLAQNSVITLAGNLNMLSGQSGETNTNASGYAMGNDTAVGAAVAINLAFSDVLTQILGSGTVAGSASLDSKTENQDDATAMALAMGAEMERYFAKIRNAEKVKAFNEKKEEENKKDEKIENETGNKISDQLKRASKVSEDKEEEDKNDPSVVNEQEKEEKDKSNPSQPLSVQALKSQNVKTESTNQTDSDKNTGIGSTVTDATDANTGDAVSGTMNEQAQEGQSIHVAASVGVNVTQHSAKTEIKGNLNAGGLKAEVENTGVFSTASTGAAISNANNSNCVGAAVAVSVNGNKALIEIPDEIKIVITGTPAEPSTDSEEKVDPILGNVALSTVLNQNSTDDGLGRYGALAVSGSSSGKGGKVGLAGSVAVMVAKGTSAIILGDVVSITGTTKSDGNTNPVTGSVTIAASDKSKLSAAAMAATKSGGSTAGVGASFALLYAENTVLAQAGNEFTVNAGSFSMTATKQAVTIKDFDSALSAQEVLTVIQVDSEGNGGYTTDDADKYGMIVLQKNKDGSYTAFTNLNSGNILDVIQLTSALASVNYYASAVAGTVMERKGDTSNQKAAVAGAVSMLFNNSVTGASIGKYANIKTSGDTEIAASSNTNTRLLGGALSSSGAKAGIGLNVATVKQKDQVYANVGNTSHIVADSFRLAAESVSDMLVITAAAVNSSGTSVGGGLNVVINDTSADAYVGYFVTITTSGNVEIHSEVDSDVILGSVTVALADGTNQGASVGAIVSVTTNASAARALTGNGVVFRSNSGNILVNAVNEEMVISVLAAAARSGNGGAGAGTLSVLTTNAKAIAGVGENGKLTAYNDIQVSAQSKAKLVDLMLAAAASTDAPAVGATIMVNVFNRETGAYLGDGAVIVSTNGNVLVQADSAEKALIISIAGAAASQNAVSGNIQVNVGNSKTYATVGRNASIKAWDSIGVTANQDSTVVAISPTISYGSGSTAVGATVQTNILGTRVEASIGENAKLIAYAQPSATNGVQTANRETKRKGIILSALAKDLVVAGGVSASAGRNAIAGVVETLVNKTIVLAKLGANAVVKTGFTSGDTVDSAFSRNDAAQQEGELTAEADAHSKLYLFGGAFSASSSDGIGATVLTLVYDKNVDAQISLSTQEDSDVRGNVNVIARTEDVVALISVNFGVSNSTAVNAGGNVLIFQNAVNAKLSGNLSASGDVTVQAENITNLVNAIASVSGSLGGTAVSGAALVTYFQGSTTAYIDAGSAIDALALYVLATSTANIHSDGVGLTVSVGSAAVSGLVNIIVTSTETQAYVGDDANIMADVVTVSASDNYDLLAIAASLSGGSNGVGVTALVTVAKNTVLAYIGDHSTIACVKLTVLAVSNRNIRNYAGSVAAGATAGVGATVMVAVIGGKLDQDSANGIAKGFKPNAFMTGMQSSVPNAAKNYLTNMNLSADLESDDAKASDLHVGDQNGDYNGTDDYRSDDFDKNYKSGTNPGENFSDSVTNTQGSELGMAKPAGEYTNVVHAYIGSGCDIIVATDALIKAAEKLNVDIVTASAAIGGTAGVNVGVAVVVAYSNVLAEIQSGTVLDCEDVTVHAVSGGDGSIADDKASEILRKAGINAATEGSSIRAIAITVGVGATAGVSPSVAVVNMASSAIARIDGVRGSAGILAVKAEMLYPNVLVVTGAVGAAGTAGVSASVAVVTFNSETYAGIINSGALTVDGMNILSNVDNTAKAYAMSLAGGAVGVNGGVAVVTNRSTTNTILGTGVYVISGNADISSNVNTNAESFIVGVSLGGVAVGLNAAVVNQDATIVTQILGNAASNLIAAGDVTVSNDVTSTAKSTVIAVVGGGIGVGGNVLLVFNNMDAKAAIDKMPFDVTGIVAVNASMKADAEANLASATVGGVSVGLSTSYVGLNAENLAYLELLQGMKAAANAILVYACKANDQNSFNATASTVAGSAGVINVNLNAAVADINASNEAKILSYGIIEGSVYVQADSQAAALAEIHFVSLGGVDVSNATAVSLLRINQLAEANITTLDNFETLIVASLLNDDSATVPSHAKLVTVSGGVYNANASVAVAYSLSENIARAILHTGTKGERITVYAGGAADAKSETLNQSGGAFSGSVYVNVAYAKGQFQSLLEVMDQVTVNDVAVQTVYTTNAHAYLTPSASGLDFSAFKFNVNLAIAKAAAEAIAKIYGSGEMRLNGDLRVVADSSNSSAVADITGAKASFSGATFGTNIADAQMMLNQSVIVKDVSVSAEGIIIVSSRLNNLSSTAETGSNIGIKMTLIGGDVNTANAAASVQNKVELENATLSAREALSIEALCDQLSVNARAKAVTANISGFNAAVTRTYAKLSRLINYVDIKTCDELSGSTVNVTASSKETKVIAQSSVPRTNASLIGFMSIAATAEIVDKQTYIHIDASKILSNIGDVVLSSFSDAIMKADSAHPSTSIGALIVNDYRFNVIVRNSLSEVTNNGNIISAQNVHITAYDNIVADIQMTDRTIAGFSHNNAVAKIDVVNQKAYIHAGGTIEAMSDIILLAKADQTLQCTVITDSKNFKDSGYVTTEVLLNRTATVDVSGDLTSQEGNIDIRALLDDRDNNSIIRVELKVNVDTWMDGSDYPRATGKVTSTAIARVKSGADLQANNLCASDKGNVIILAKSAGNMLVKTVRTMDKVFGQNASFATAEMKETVRTDIGENGGKATISGRNVDISAQSDMSVVSEAYSYTYVQLGLTFKPTATTVFCSDIDTTVNGADIRASELLSVSAYLPFAQARAHAYALKDWLVGYNAPSATVKGNIYTDVLFYTNSSLSAKNINVKAFSPTDQDSNVRIERIEEWHHWSNNGEKVTSFNTTEAAKKTGSSLNTYLKEKLFIPGTYKSNVTDEKNVYFCGNVLWSQPSSNPNSSNKTDVSLAENTAAVTITISKDDRVSISGFKSGVVYGDIVNHITSGNIDVYEILGDRVRELAAVTTTTGKVSVKAYSHRNSYNTFTDTTLSKLDVTIRNDSDSDLLLNNLNEAESFSHVNGGSELVVIMTNSGSETGKAPDLIFNGGGDYSHGKIHVTLSGGNMRLENGAQIKARNITVLDAGSILAVDENGNPVDLVFTNSGYTGNAADSSINLQVKEALNLILKTSNSSYVIDRIQTGGDLVLKVENVYGKDKAVAVILGELISGGDVTLTVPYSVESAKSDEVNISGDGIYLTAGGAVGTSNRFLRIDSSVNQISGITVTAFGGIYLKEVSGDLYINQIANLGTGNIAIWTENGSIHSDPTGTSDNLEDLDRYMMLYAEAGVMYGNAGDMIHVLLQYLSDLLRIQEALQTKGEEVLEIARKEIDILHDVTSVETALAIIQDELRYIGGEEYQNPEIGHALMNGALQGDQLTDAFNAEVDRLAKDENATIGGELSRYLVIWRDNYLEMAEYLQNAVNCYKAALANSIHIFGSGDLHLHLQSSNGTASVSKDINSLSLSVGGKVTITTAQNTVLKDVYLESYDALTLDPIVATDVIDLYSVKGIFAAKNSNQVLLDANELVLRSLLEGNLGTARQTLILNTNLLDALGNYVYLENRKDLVIDMVIALEDLYLTVKGNVNDQHDDDVILNGIHGNNITLNVSGDIGRADDSDPVVGFERQDENVTIVSDDSLNITARNLYMAGHGNILIGSIHTDGMTSINVVNGSIMNAAKGSGIWCDSLKLYAYGMIGTPEDPLEIHSNGIYSSGGGGLMRSLFRARAAENTEENSPKQDTLMADSYLYGENIRIIPLVSQNVGMHNGINVAFQNMTVTDSDSGIRVTGAMGKGAVLIISDISDHTDDICKLLMQHHQLDGRIFVNLKLLNNHTGNLTVQIPVTEELAEYEGREIVILTCRDGVIWAIRATVINGFITFCTEELGAFLIFGDPAQLVLTEDGTQIILAQQYLPFGGWL